MDPDKIVDGLSRELNSALRSMSKAKVTASFARSGILSKALEVTTIGIDHRGSIIERIETPWNCPTLGRSFGLSA